MLITLTGDYWNDPSLFDIPEVVKFLDHIEDAVDYAWNMFWVQKATGESCTECRVPFVKGEYALCSLGHPHPPVPTICLECSVARFVPNLPVPDFLISKEAVSDGDSRIVD